MESSFSNAPDEILYIIFRDLSRYNLIECQKVCRLWRFPAQRSFMKEVTFIRKLNVDKFLEFMDSNVDPNYAKATKKLIIGKRRKEPLPKGKVLSTNDVRRLLFCFSNINEIQLQDNLAPLQKLSYDPICLTAAQIKWPKLERITVQEYTRYLDSKSYHRMLYRLRNVVVEVKLGRDKYLQQYNGPLRFLTGFSRLQHANICRSLCFTNFKAILPLFEQLPHLNALTCRITALDKMMFVDDYLVMKQKHEQMLLIERLSKLRAFKVEYLTFSTYTIDFIIQYLTGLSHLTVTLHLDRNWTDVELSRFCNKLLDYTVCLQNYKITLTQVNKTILPSLSFLLQKVFQPLSSFNKFQVKAFQIYRDATIPFDFTVSSEKIGNRETANLVCLQCAYLNEDNSLEVTRFFESPSLILENIDTFEFDYYPDYLQPDVYRYILFNVLDRSPSLKKLILQIPSTVFPDDASSPNGKYPQITHLELSICSEDALNAIQHCIHMFPKLEHLTMSYFSLEWKQLQLRLQLEECELERMHLDVTAFRNNSSFIFNGSQIEPFIVIKVNFIKRKEKYMYKVRTDYLGVFRVEAEDLQNLKRKTDYFEVNISLHDIQYLNLYLYKKELKSREVDYFNLHPEDIMEAKLSFV